MYTPQSLPLPLPLPLPDDMVRDIGQTLAWVRQSIGFYGGDTEKIVLMGHSAGAHLVALCVLDRCGNCTTVVSLQLPQSHKSLTHSLGLWVGHAPLGLEEHVLHSRAVGFTH
jgi:carboxylesterase family protein